MLESLHQRLAKPEDKDFVNNLFYQVMKPYVDLTWADEEDRDACYERNSRCDENTIILESGNSRIGYFVVIRSSENLFLDQIHLLPEFQGKGIGQQIVKNILIEAEQEKLPIELVVLKVNPAKKLYEKLGFHITRSDEFRHYMTWSPVK